MKTSSSSAVAMERPVEDGPRREPKRLTCEDIFADALILRNRVTVRFGSIQNPRPGAQIREVYKAWSDLADAWEVAEDACLEDGTREGLRYAKYARGFANQIATALQDVHQPRHDPSSPRVKAVAALKLAQQHESRLHRRELRGHDGWWTMHLYLSAAHLFKEAGKPRRAAAILRYLRLKGRDR